MLKTLTIVLGLAAFAGCKTDAPAASDQPAETTAQPSGAKGRSGKIDLPNVPRSDRPSLPGDQPRTEGERDAVSQQARDERRKQRMNELDTDGDGEISEEERAAARAKRDAAMVERLDTNKDGKVDDAERDVARKDRATDMHARLDKNGDGKLSVEEMQTGRLNRMADPGVDTNGDGDVSVEEIDAMMKNRPMRGPGRRGGWNRGGGGGLGGSNSGSAQVQ
jgi:Ca2+-binding EF-hand superfamily protein